MFFLARYCRLLEEGSFRGRTADFAWMLFLGGAALTAAAPFVSIQFLGSSLTFMMVYVWGRRNAFVTMRALQFFASASSPSLQSRSFLGLFNFTAPYLPWVLLAFSWLLGSSPLVDALGIATGHAYYYLEDVYPRLSGCVSTHHIPSFLFLILIFFPLISFSSRPGGACWPPPRWCAPFFPAARSSRRRSRGCGRGSPRPRG